MAENAHRRHLPFEEFINRNLDMAGVDGISFETVALAMRDFMREQAADSDFDIDRLQETLQGCQSIEIINQLLQRYPAAADVDPNLMDEIVATTMLLAFSCYNALATRFDFEPPALTDANARNQRLWNTLRAASGWVNKAASDGDAVARGMAREIDETLDSTTPPGWSNNTRNLPR